MTVDKEQDIVVTFPEDYGAADLAGKGYFQSDCT